MQISVSSTLTLYHDGQFWIGVVEHEIVRQDIKDNGSFEQRLEIYPGHCFT